MPGVSAALATYGHNTSVGTRKHVSNASPSPSPEKKKTTAKLSSKPPVPYPKPQVDMAKAKPGQRGVHETRNSHSIDSPDSSKQISSPGRAPRAMKQVSTQNKDLDKLLEEQRLATALAKRNLLASERQCVVLQNRIDELEAERNHEEVASLTDDQRGAIQHAEHKVKQLQETIFSLSNRLFLTTTINEETETESNDELSVANRRIEFLLKQVDSEFCKRREMEKEMAELQVQLAKQAERTAAVRDVPLNGCAAGQTVKGVSRDSHDDGFQPSPLSDQFAMTRQKLSVAEQQVVSMTLQLSKAEQQSQCLEVERDQLKKKVQETEAMFELLSDEKDLAAEDCRRAQVNMRAAQKEQRELMQGLETLRAEIQEERHKAETQRSAAQSAKEDLSRVQLDLEAASSNVRSLQSQVHEVNELQLILEEQRTIATSCQRAVDDITARCNQLEAEKEDLQAELSSRHHHLVKESSREPSTASEDGALQPNGPSHSTVPYQSDSVKLELWRLQRENVLLRQRIYKQLAGREHQDEQSQDEPMTGSETPPVSSPTADKWEAKTSATLPPRSSNKSYSASHEPSKVSSLTRASTKRHLSNDPRRRPLLLDTSSTMPSMRKASSHDHHTRAENDLDVAKPALPPKKGNVQTSFMVDLHVGSRRNVADDDKEDESEKSETLEVNRLVERLLGNLATVRFWGSSEVEEHVRRLCCAYQRVQKELEECRERLQSSESDLKKNRRALVRSLSEKRSAENRPHVAVRDKSKEDKSHGSGVGGSQDQASATPSAAPAITLTEYEIMVSTLTEKIKELRTVAEVEQVAKARVEQAFQMHQRVEDEIQHMLQDEVNNLRRLNIKLAADTIQAPQAAEMLGMIQRAQEDELALQQVDGLRSLVQDLQLALLQKEQAISSLEWKMADAQADITVLHAERDCHVRQLQHAHLTAGQGLSDFSVLYPVTTAAMTASTMALSGDGRYKDTAFSNTGGTSSRLNAMEALMQPSIMPNHSNTMRRDDFRSKSRSSGGSLQDDRRSLSEGSLTTVVCKDAILTSAMEKAHSSSDSDERTDRMIAKRNRKWSSVSGLPMEVAMQQVSPPLESTPLSSATDSNPAGKVKHSTVRSPPSLQTANNDTATEPSDRSSLSSSASAIYSRPRSHSVPVERQSSAEECGIGVAATLKLPSKQNDLVAARARDVTKGLAELMGNTEGDEGETASRSVDETHEMALRTVQAAVGTTWQVIMRSSELNEASKFSNTDLCHPVHVASPFMSGSSRLGTAASHPHRPGHRRNCSEGNMQNLPAFLSSLGNQVGDGSKDNTWKRLKRGDSPSGLGGSRPGMFSPSGEGSAFDKWPRVKEKLERALSRQKLEDVGGNATWASVSTESSTGLSLATTSSHSPSASAEDNDSACDSLGVFRPYVNGHQPGSPPARDFGMSSAFTPVVASPKVVPVKVLGGTPGGVKTSHSNGNLGVQQLPNDEEHCFRPVSVMTDKSDTQSITSTGTVVVQDDTFEPCRVFREQQLTDKQIRRRSTSDVHSTTQKALEPVRSSKTPPHTFSVAIRPLASDKARASKTPDSSSGMTITHPSNPPPPPPTSTKADTSTGVSVSAGTASASTSANTNSSGKGKSGSWLRRGSRRTSNDSEAGGKAAAAAAAATAAGSSGSDSNPTSRGRMGSSTSASLTSIHSTGRKEAFSSKLRKDNKSASRYGSGKVDENLTPTNNPATTPAPYSPFVVSPHHTTASAPYTPKAASPQGLPELSSALAQRSSTQVLRSSSNRLSMTVMEPLMLTRDQAKEKVKRSKQQQAGTKVVPRGTIC